MRVCVLAEYYPRRRDPVLGIWAHRQALAARDAGAELKVVLLERRIPTTAAARALRRGDPRPLGRELRALASEPRRRELDGLEIEYVRFAAPRRERSYARWADFARPPLHRALDRLHERFPFDVLHAHYAAPAGDAALPWARRAGVPLAVSVHGGDLLGRAFASPPARTRVATVLRGATAVLCNSRAMLARASELAGGGAGMRVVHLGAAPPAEDPVRHEQPTVATLGHVIPRKRHDDVLRAFRIAKQTVPEARWKVIGDGPALPPLRALAAELGVAESVEFAGALEPDRALEELARCQLMALPSVDEAFGVAYVEALACGVPAIGSRGEGGPEEIAALVPAMLLVPPGDVEELAARIGEVLGDRRRLHELSAAARAGAAEHFSWEACGRATVAAYEDARARAGGAR